MTLLEKKIEIKSQPTAETLSAVGLPVLFWRAWIYEDIGLRMQTYGMQSTSNDAKGNR